MAVVILSVHSLILDCLDLVNIRIFAVVSKTYYGRAYAYWNQRCVIIPELPFHPQVIYMATTPTELDKYELKRSLRPSHILYIPQQTRKLVVHGWMCDCVLKGSLPNVEILHLKYTPKHANNVTVRKETTPQLRQIMKVGE